MKTNILKLAAALAVSSAMLVGCDLFESIGTTPTVSIVSNSDTFDAQGDAVVTLSLSSIALEEVSVALSVSGDAANIVSLDKVVKIGLGSKNQSFTVHADLGALKNDSSVVITIASATGATVGAPKEVTLIAKAGNVQEETPATLSVEADEEFSAEATATLTLKLDKAAKEDVSVEFEVLSADDYATIPAEALTFNNPAVIAAGQISATVTISVDAAKLPTGDNYALIGVKSVQGANAPRNTEFVILYSKPIVANLRQDWSIAYSGTNAEGNDVISVTGLADTDTYYIFNWTPGDVAANFNDMTEFLNYVESRLIAPYLGTADAEEILVGNADYPFNKLNLGGYEFYLIGCNSSTGHVSGDYATVSFTIKPSAELLEAYDSWLGEWQFGTDILTVNEADKSAGTYTITTTPTTTTYSIDAKIGWNKELLFLVTDPASEAGNVGFFGYYPSEQQGYISIYTGSMPLGEAFLDQTGEGGTIQRTYDGYFDGMALFTYSGNSITGWGELEIDFSKVKTFKRPVTEASPEYSRWIGSWKVGDTDTVLTLNEDLLDESLVIETLAPVAGWYASIAFDTESGNLKYLFNYNYPFTYDGVNYSIYSSGITNAGYVALGDDNYVIANFIFNADGSATIEPVKYADKDQDNNDIEDFAVSIGLLGYSSSAGWLNVSGNYIAIPTTLTKMEEGTAVPESVSAKRMQSFTKFNGIFSGNAKSLHREIAKNAVRKAESFR